MGQEPSLSGFGSLPVLAGVAVAIANDYFADGLTDEIKRNLFIIDELAVQLRRPSTAWSIGGTAEERVSEAGYGLWPWVPGSQQNRLHPTEPS